MSLRDKIAFFLLERREGNTGAEDVEESPQQSLPEEAIYNPFRLSIHDIVELRSEDAGRYEVYEITEHTIRFADTLHQATRYFLRDCAATNEFEPLALELMRTHIDKPPRPYLFRIVEEFEYDDDFLKLLDNDIFILSEETDTEEIHKEYGKRYHISSKTLTIDETRRIRKGTVNVWAYELEYESETLYLVVEMEQKSGWTTIYEGRRLLEGEVDMYTVSAQGGEQE